jgi:hypothetical protein
MIWMASRGGSIISVFPWSLLVWIGYFSGHVVATGKVVDETSRQTSASVPRSPALVFLSIAGISSMVVAFPTAILAIQRGSYLLLFFAETCFICGYIGGHYGFTRLPL